MARKANTQSSPVLTPMGDASKPSWSVVSSTSWSYKNGWRQMWKYFLRLLLIGIIGFVIILPSEIGSEEGSAVGLGILGLIYTILVTGPIEYGLSFVYLKAARNDEPEIRDMFKAFSNYRNAVLAHLLVVTIVTIGFFLFIIPGIIFACKFAFTPYLIVDRRMAAIEAVKESWRMTRGYTWTVFLIGLLTIPISIIGLICLIIGIVPALMWISATFASLYHTVSTPSEAKMA